MSPAADKFWLASVGAPTHGRRFVALNVCFAWSWCCRLGVIAWPGEGPVYVGAEELATCWHVTVRPASRYEESTLCIEGVGDNGPREADMKLPRCRGSYVHHLGEGCRQATFGILIDHGSVSFFIRSTGGTWASTGVVAESSQGLVAFVGHPLQEAELLDLTEPPWIPARNESVFESLNSPACEGSAVEP